MKKNNIKVNTIYSIIKSVSAILFPLISFPYASRTLLPEGIGKVNFANSIVNYFSLLASLGLNTYAIRECSRVRDCPKDLSKVASELFSINMVTTGLSYVLLGVTLLFARPLDSYRMLIVVQSTTIMFHTLGMEWINSVMEDFRFITLRTVSFQMLALVLMFLLVKTPEDYLKYAMIMVVSQSGANIVNMLYRRKYCHVTITRNMQFRRHISPILLLFAMQISQVIFTNADTTMLGLLHSDTEVGIYSTAVKVYNIVSQVVSSILWVVMPRLSLYYAKKDYSLINPLLRKTLGFCLALGLPCITGLNMLSKEIVEIIGGVEYLDAAPVLQILTFSLLFSLIGGNFIGNIIMLPSLREKYFLVACIIAAVANVVLNALLIPTLSVHGAAIATVVSSLIILIVLLPRVEKEIQLGVLGKLVGPPVIGCVFIIVSCMIIKHIIYGLWIRFIIAVGTSVVGYGLILVMCRFELIDPIIAILKKKLIKGDR